ncbi:MAG: hypothetical protein D3924_07940 [Candidatus Electrothrix sp. AR4]|nr:hypothetical protein [Candidatus Electrothrix sp. AR4]
MAFFLIIGFSAEAFASQPRARRGAFYNMAKRTSSRLVSSSWRSLGGDCNKADQLMQIIGDAVDRVTRDIRRGKFRGRMAVDFGNGYIEGLVGSLDDIVNHCSNECSMIGQASGEWSAEIFCAVSEVVGRTAQFDGLQDRPNLICGEAYRMSCESSFVGQSKRMCSQFAAGIDFDNYYRASAGGCCSYDMED